MIEISDKSKCCGCSACVQRCPKQCIIMKEDEEGFLYPHVDTEICIDCGLCEKVCPIINQAETKEPLKVYAVKNRNLQKRELSSSGGLFIALAEKNIEKDGVVFGVVFDENWEAHHVAATTLEELEPMMRSKYMQSRVENTFAETEKYLKEDKEVMYIGTSCQIAALKLYLRKEYNNLFTIDFICHGVRSPGVWRKYLNETFIGKFEVTDISFREKSRTGHNWQKFGFVVWGNSLDDENKKLVMTSDSFTKNPYMKGFLKDLYLRPSCYSCPAKGGTSRSDLTIADFWGVKRFFPSFFDLSGVGLAIINTDKGESYFNCCDFESKKTTLCEATYNNPVYFSSTSKPEKREFFFKHYILEEPFNLIIETCTYVSPWRKVIIFIKKYFGALLNRIKC